MLSTASPSTYHQVDDEPPVAAHRGERRASDDDVGDGDDHYEGDEDNADGEAFDDEGQGNLEAPGDASDASSTYHSCELDMTPANTAREDAASTGSTCSAASNGV